MNILFTNNAKTLVDTTLLIGTLSVVVDNADDFPSPTGGQYFYATIQNPADDTDFEIVKCTAKSGTTITIQRAQEGTSAAEWATGSLFELRLTAGGIDALKAHAADHIMGGSAEIDGDRIDIDWNPTNYTPTAVAEADNADHLTQHLAGINARVAPASQDARGTIEIATQAEAQTGSDTGMAITPSTLTAVLKQQSWMQGDGLYIGADKIRARDGDGLNLEDDGGNGIHIADGGGVLMDAGVRVNRVAVNDANRINTTLSTDYIVAFTALTAPRAYQISSEDIAQTNRLFIIKDESGAARTYNITISTEGAETIDGADTVVISNAYGAITLYSNGSNLFIH